MMSSIQVQVGDLIELCASSDAVSPVLVQGRVMQVDAEHPMRCEIQVSPFEPFRQVDLAHAPHKIVFGVGDITRLKPDMIGWAVEILVDEKDPCGAIERGVIKQVDSDLNCALLAFDDGQKDWRDLTMNAFKVVGLAVGSDGIGSCSSVANKSQHLVVSDVPRFHLPIASTVHAIQSRLPQLEANEFEWYTEGGHVELCDGEGNYCEGALLSSLRDKSLQLYNEKRQFFEVQMAKQSFKVVIHGLVALKSVPLGQVVEIYSPMHGEFRRGRVLKAAELGKLTPVRFEDIGVEWLDLTSQTFKLVFLTPEIATETTEPSTSKVCSNEIDNGRNQDSSAPHGRPDIESHGPTSETKELDGSVTSTVSPKREHRHHHHERSSHRNQSLRLPALYVGHAIELFEPTTKQFIKYRVVRVHGAERPHEYDVEVAPSSNTGSSLALSVARAADAERHLRIDLSTVKARVQLTVDNWDLHHPILLGYRVDVYDKADRSVLNGKIIDTVSADDVVSARRVLVKLKDGAKRWFDVKSTKIKLKLVGDVATKSAKEVVPPSDAMWERVDPPELEDSQEVTSNTTPERATGLAKQQSEKIKLEPKEPSPLTRYASTPHIIHENQSTTTSSPSRVPTLDLRGVTRKQADEDAVPLPTTESMTVEQPNEMERSSGSNAEALSDLLPAMDDVWMEESTLTAGVKIVRYVHIGTGEVSTTVPQWLKQTDEMTGESFIMNTITGVKFQPPGSSSSLTTTPQSSGRGVVVTLPIGPLEAARVASQMITGVSSADLLAEAFGP